MRYHAGALVLIYLSFADAYTKYGRSCKDIGCPSNQVCVMETDPCSYYQRQGECGTYPTCKKTGSSERSCSTYVCPPTKVCKMDGDTPKCVDDHSARGHVGYNTQNQNNLGQQNPDQPSAPSAGNLYPTLNRGETTPRPNVYNPAGQGGAYQGGVAHGETTPRPNAYHPPAQGGGYQGGRVGSGYPGYPQQQGGYPQQQGGYPQQGYQQPGGYPPQGGYQQGYYPQGHNQGYYNQGRYPQGGNQGQGGYQPYPGYGGYQQGGYQQGYGNKQTQSSGSSFSDQISNTLKTIGTDVLKNALGKILSGNRN